MMNTWLWPDRTIGKAESRELREEHNAVVNQSAALREGISFIIADSLGDDTSVDWIRIQLNRLLATEAINKASQ
jgi:hypothetical protein